MNATINHLTRLRAIVNVAATPNADVILEMTLRQFNEMNGSDIEALILLVQSSLPDDRKEEGERALLVATLYNTSGYTVSDDQWEAAEKTVAMFVENYETEPETWDLIVHLRKNSALTRGALGAFLDSL